MLVAEDRDEDSEILKLACARTGVKLPLRFVRDGGEVLDYLQGDGEFGDRANYPLPRLLLLDLNMPRMGGFEVLQWVRLQPAFRHLVVIIFTSSELPEDIAKAFDLGANAYLVKPVDFHKLEQIVRYLEEYWSRLTQKSESSLLAEPLSGNWVLLRSAETRQFYAGPGHWAPDPRHAFNFERSERAVQSAISMGLRRFELVFDWEREISAAPKVYACMMA